jgi:5-methyltetrahydrofolate--homocysteine methyltransferase
MKQSLDSVYRGIVQGDMEAVEQAIEQTLQAGLGAEQILKNSLIPAMAEVGRLYEEGEYFVPEMLIAARAMQAGLTALRPLLVASDVQPIGKVAAGTVKGDLHEIGKNLVCMMLEGAGFEVQDLGVDVSPRSFVEAVRAGDVGIVAMSALLTTTMPNMKATVEALEQSGLRDRVKVIIGGAPVTDAYAQAINADGFAPDASQAATLAKSLVT